MKWTNIGVIKFLQCIFIIAPFIFCTTALAAQLTGEINLRVLNLKSNQGEVLFGLYDTEEAFKSGDGYAIVKGSCIIKNFQCELIIPEMPYGTYAIMAGHDINKNGKISRNPFSDERKGASNYKKKLWWFPDFKKAKFIHNKSKTILVISVY